MTTTDDEILNFKEVKKLLKVSSSFLYKKTAKGEIPCYRPTKGKLFFKKNEVLEWLKNDFG